MSRTRCMIWRMACTRVMSRSGSFKDESERLALARLTAATYADPEEPASVAELGEVLAGLLALGCWPGGFDGGPRSLAALKNLTSELIGRFCRAAEERDEAVHGGGKLTRYAADLIVPRRQRLECALLKGVTAHYVMSRPGAGAVRARQRELIAGLADAVARGAPATLDPVLAARLGGRAVGSAPTAGGGRPDGLAHRHIRGELASPAVRRASGRLTRDAAPGHRAWTVVATLDPGCHAARVSRPGWHV